MNSTYQQNRGYRNVLGPCHEKPSQRFDNPNLRGWHLGSSCPPGLHQGSSNHRNIRGYSNNLRCGEQFQHIFTWTESQCGRSSPTSCSSGGSSAHSNICDTTGENVHNGLLFFKNLEELEHPNNEVLCNLIQATILDTASFFDASSQLLLEYHPDVVDMRSSSWLDLV